MHWQYNIDFSDIDNIPHSKLDQKRKIVKDLVEIKGLGITEKMAKAAVQQNIEFPLDKGDCLRHCIELMESLHENDDTKICALASQFDNEIGRKSFF